MLRNLKCIATEPMLCTVPKLLILKQFTAFHAEDVGNFCQQFILIKRLNFKIPVYRYYYQYRISTDCIVLLLVLVKLIVTLAVRYRGTAESIPLGIQTVPAYG